MHNRWWTLAEWIALMLLVFVHAGLPAPGVNEVHYLTKAKHYWQPEWCHRDLFLTSGNAHAVFYITFGWMTRFWSLETTAWLGRLAGWSLVCWAWFRLSWAVIPVRGASLVSAALFLAGLYHAHMAGEWVVGGIEAKVIAYALVMAGLAEAVRGRWSRSWIWLGAASAFHAIVGGWSVVAVGVAYAAVGHSRDEPVARQVLPLVLGGLLALVGVAPAWQLEAGATPEQVAEGHRIYVYERLSHHLVFREFPAWRVQRHALLVAVLAWLTWTTRMIPSARRLAAVAWGAVAISLTGILLDYWFASQPLDGARWLRFYWFRLGDVFVPLAVALLALAWVDQPYAASVGEHAGGAPIDRSRSPGWAVAIAVATLGIAVPWWRLEWPLWPEADLHGSLTASQNPTRARLDWISTCQWIDRNLPPDVLVLTPPGIQSFKWYAQRAEWASRKHIPQDSASIVEWRRRLSILNLLDSDPENAPKLLSRLADEESIDFAVVSIRLLPYLPGSAIVYHNGTFAVLWLPRGSQAPPAATPRRGEAMTTPVRNRLYG